MSRYFIVKCYVVAIIALEKLGQTCPCHMDTKMGARVFSYPKLPSEIGESSWVSSQFAPSRVLKFPGLLGSMVVRAPQFKWRLFYRLAGPLIDVIDSYSHHL
jgi:hypothetical protein